MIKEVKELETYYKKDITQLIDDLDRWVNHKQFVHSKCYVVGNGLSRKDIDLEKKCMRSCTEIYMQSVSPRGEEMFIPFFQYMYILEANWRPTGNSSMNVDYYWILGLNSCFGMQMVRASTVVFDANVTRFCQNVFDRLSDVGIVLMPSPLQSTSKAGCSKNEDLQLMT